MVMFLLFGVIAVVVSLLLLAFTVLLRDRTSRLNISFFAFSLTTAVWVCVNFLGSNFKSNALAPYFIYADFIFGPLIGLSFSVFAMTLIASASKYRVKSLTKLLLLLLAFVALGLISLDQTVSLSTVKGVTSISYGSLYDLYAFVTMVIFATGVYILFAGWKKATLATKTQFKNILIGLVIAVLFVAFANLIIPQITDSEVINLAAGNLSYLSILLFVGFMAHTIIKHRLFDIKLVAARSLGYILAIGTLGLAYGFVAFYVMDQLLLQNVSPGTFTRQLLYTSLAVLSGLAFAPAKKLFDKLSDRIFYQDTYDSKDFIDDFTNLLVSNSEATSLLKKSSKLIVNILKSSFVEFDLDQGLDLHKDITGVGNRLSRENIEKITDYMDKKEEQLILTDEIEGYHNQQVRQILARKNIALVVRIANPQQQIGLIAIGFKQSGNTYTPQDLEVIRIVADELSIALQNYFRFEQINKFNTTLQNEVDDATKRLRSSNAKLKSLDETKDEFISMASHQLRTPLTSVKGYMSMVLEGDAGKLNEQQKKLLNQAFISSQRMNYLISDLLNLSRLKTGKFEIQATPTSLPDVIESELDQLNIAATARGLNLSFDKPKDFPVLNLDETKVRQVIMNFVDNAIYYNQAGGNISIELEALPKMIEFRVVDDGLGVPKKDQHNLFSKFFRADNARKARPDGTGLGLFMAKKVIIAQGGAIIFKSQEGKGSTFGFTFPRSKLELKTKQKT